jgi:hypothetical protein
MRVSGHGWREWLRITSFVAVGGVVIVLIGVTAGRVVTYLIALLR